VCVPRPPLCKATSRVAGEQQHPEGDNLAQSPAEPLPGNKGAAADSQDVGLQTGESEEHAGANVEHLLEVRGDRLSLDTETVIRGDGHAVLATHGHYASSVVG